MNTLITALATPYKNGKIDYASYERLVNYQLKNGVNALLAVGTTAEAQLLEKNEKRELVKRTKSLAKRTPVWVGIGGSSTVDAIKEATFAQNLGADGLLVAPPAFVKCTPEGYLLHIEDILRVATVPVMLYNAPSRCNYTLDKNVVAELSKRVRYLKDAGKDLNYTAALSTKLKVLCGNDQLLPEMLKNGAKGVVSVVSNVAPLLTKRVLNGAEPALTTNNGRAKCRLYANEQDLALFYKLAELSMLEVSPIAIKYMLYKKGIFTSFNMRLPLTRASEDTQRKINKIWKDYIE